MAKKKEKNAEKQEGESKPLVKVTFSVEGKGEIQALLEGADLGYANLLVEKLLEDKGVSFAAAEYVHPTQCTPLLKVKAKGDVKKAIGQALKEVEKEIKSLTGI
ncbi:TPA: hypothetical protein HA244_02230 [Candidatus Micrarchaeota archaeon]|nr:hypothetical protein [Candidatus Micrarchaeota archaeon]